MEGAAGKELERILLKTIVPGMKDPELDRLLALIHRVGYRKRMAEEADEKDVDVPVELQIVRDADALDAIGAVGVFRVSAYGGKHALDIGRECRQALGGQAPALGPFLLLHSPRQGYRR